MNPMRIALTVFLFFFGIVAHAAHLAPWNPDGIDAGVSMVGMIGGYAMRYGVPPTECQR